MTAIRSGCDIKKGNDDCHLMGQSRWQMTLTMAQPGFRRRLQVYASEETVEIFVEADFETHAEEQRRFAILNVPRHLFSEATGEAARRAAKKDR
jgi:hypothetical protein